MFIKVKGVWSDPKVLDNNSFTILINIRDIVHVVKKLEYDTITIRGSGTFYTKNDIEEKLSMCGQLLDNQTCFVNQFPSQSSNVDLAT